MLEGAKWVSFYGEEAPKVRTEIVIKKELKSAKIEICGLGLFNLFINGKKVNDEFFPMLWSDFHKRDMSNMLYNISVDPTYRIYVPSYDITSYLRIGKNALGVILGNGWYNQHERNIEGYMPYGSPTLCYKITATYKSGEEEVFVSDENLKWSKSHIIFNNLFFGEEQDLRLYSDAWKYSDFNDADWKFSEIKEAPDTILSPKESCGDKIIRTLSPKLISTNGNKKIYSCGENITGLVKVRLKGKEGEYVIIEYAEEIDDRFNLDFFSCGMENQIQRDVFICSKEERSVHAMFTWHGFSYFSIEGNAEAQECLVIHSPVSNRTSFKCDNNVLNWLYDAYVRTQLDNFHLGVPSDCPHRERLGYTGDGQITCNAAMYVFDADSFYRKWLRDILDCQHRESGRVQHTAPFYGGGGGCGGWGGAIVIVPYMHYKHFFDTAVLKESYPYMEKWACNMVSQMEDGLVMHEEKGADVVLDYWNLGEWFTPEKVELPKEYVNTYFFIKTLMYMEEIALITGADFLYKDLIETLKENFKKKYYNETDHTFFGSKQGADAFAIDIGLGDGITLEKLIGKYSVADGFDTGIFGTYILLDVLFKNGYPDIAVKLMTQNSKNSFYNMMKNGATTLWESWDGISSHNHPMFGASVSHIFKYLIGIDYIDKDNIVIKPCFTDLLGSIDACAKTNSGTISVKYQICNGEYNVSLTKNCKENVTFVYNDKKWEVNENIEFKTVLI